jgi:penicillin-binding protein 2
MPVSVNNNDPYSFATRLAACVILVCVCFSCLFLRLINLQIVQSAEYKAKAEENRIALLPVVPNRGLILDRNGIILARNYSTFTLEITPSKISYPLDEIIQKLSNIINI